MAEFKLGRIRFVWKNEWQASTTYYRDDVIRFGGRVYICVIGHTSAVNFFTDLDVVPSKWNLVSDGQRWKGDWATSTSYITNDIVKYGANLYIANTVHTSNSSASAGLEADISNWDLFGSGLDWKGSWATATRYKVDDLVKYGGKSYVANTAHTSNASATSGLEADQSKWDIFNAGIEYKTDWSTGTRYKLNDIVKYGGSLYICTTYHTSTNFASDSGNWAEFVEGIQFEDIWGPYGTYQKGDIVKYGGYQYIALRQNIGVKPYNNTSDWKVFSKGMNFRGEWGDDSSTQDYLTGDVVTVGGHTYLAKADSNNKEPGEAGDWTTYWDRLNSGFRWRNQWLDDAYYVIGDVVKFGSNSYVCIQSHVSEGDDYSTETRTGAGGGAQNSRPDLDSAGAYWNILILGNETSVLTTKGDLVFYGGAGPTRLPVGTDGQVLRVSPSGIPEWTYFGENPDVYYVSSAGVDSPAPIRGTTLEAPWKTIRYACMAVENGTKFPNARKLLELNRVWLQRETVEWTDYQVANDISPFTTAFTYEETKCERDVGYIVDAIVYDLCHGGNVKSRESALRYVNEPGQFYIKGQEEETVASLAYALTIMGNVLAQTDPAVSYQTTNGDNSTAIVSQYKNTAVTAEPTALTRVTELLKIITDAITAGNDTGIPARIELNTLIRVATGSYKEVLPIRVPALCCVMGDELRAVTVKPQTKDDAIATAREDAKYSLKSIERLADVVGNVTTGGLGGAARTKATYTNESVNDWPIGGPKEKIATEKLARVIRRNIDHGIGDKVEKIFKPAYDMGANAVKGYARDNLLLNKEFIKEEIVAYVNTNYPNLKHSKTKCRQDVGYIIDGIAYDLTYDGNWQSQNVGLAYYDGRDGNETLQINSSEKPATLAAYTHLKSLLQTVGQNITVNPTQQTVVTQKTGASNSNAATSNVIATLMQGIIDIIDNGVGNAYENITYPDISNVDQALVDAYNTLTDFKQKIGDDTIDFVSKNFGTYRYNSALCRRDLRKIMRDTAYDVALGTNFNAVYTGIAYKRGNNAYNLENQRTQTVGGIEKARDLLKVSVTTDGSSATGSSNASARITTAFNEITDIIQRATLSNAIPGDGTVDALSLPSPAGVDQNRVDAKDNLIANKTFIAADINAYVANTYPSHSHDAAKCTRDTGYLIDGLAYDILYGGNQGTMRNADSFINDRNEYVYGVDGSATAITKAAYAHFKTIVSDIVREISVTPQTGNSQTQVTPGTAATATEGTELENKLDIILDTLTPRTASSGTTYDPSTGHITINIGAHNLEVGGIVAIKTGAIKFTCAMDGHSTFHDYPRATDPAGAQTPFSRLRIFAVTSNTITVDVGKSQNTSVHTFVSGVANAIIPTQPIAITYPSITWADAEYQTAHSDILSDSENIVRDVIQHLQDTYSGFTYLHRKCTRDIGYIIDAAGYDWMLGTNFASMVAAYSYLREPSKKVTGEQKDATLAANEFARTQAIKHINFNHSAEAGIKYTWRWVNDIIFGGSNEANNDQSSELNNHATSRLLELNKEFIVEECIAYTDVHFRARVEETEVTDQKITIGRNFTPTNATYNASTGALVLTIPGHDFTKDVDYIKIERESISFTCTKDGGSSITAYPRINDIGYNKMLRITDVSGDTLTVNIGASPVGLQYTHTFVSAANNCVRTQNTEWLEQGLAIKFEDEADSTTSVTDIGLVAGTVYYVKEIVSDNEFTISETPHGSKKSLTAGNNNCIVSRAYDNQFTTACARDLREIVDGMKFDVVYAKDYTRDYTDRVEIIVPGNYRSKFSARYYINAVMGSQEEDMYYLRNATGLRLMTLDGLNGDLGPANEFGTSRPTAGAYASLDPGWGPKDKRVWIQTRSPYVQNVTTFGNAATGQRIDGALHDGGNDSIVSNDFTQVISDGIGAHILNNGRAELVSVFTYYSHIGYLAESGGRIRATNGNNSYGDFGSVAEGVDNTEVPVTAIVDNKFQFKATISKVETDGDKPIVLEYDHAGNDYTEASIGIFGAGNSAETEADEFRDNAVNRIRILDLDDSSGDLGGKGYTIATNTAQAGTTTSITIAATDGNPDTAYPGMRVVITGGQGVGQYGKIDTYNSGAKLANVLKNDGSAGFEHLRPGTPIVAPNASSIYLIEPNVEFTAPPHRSTAQTLVATQNTTDMEYCETAKIYTNVTGTETTTAGTGCRFTVYRNGSKYIPLVTVGGSNYARGDTINLLGTSLGGTTPANDLLLTVTSVNATTGAITVVDNDGIGLSGEFIAAGNASATIQRSTDGITWTTQALGSFVPTGPVKIANGLLNDGSSTERTSATLIIGQKGSGAIQLWYSQDAHATWTAQELPGGPYNGVPHIVFGDNKFFVIFENQRHVFESGDGGVTWIKHTDALATTGYTGLAYGGKRIVAVRSGTTVSAYANTNNADTWTATTLPGTSAWIGIAHGNNTFVCIANDDNKAAYSMDRGETWITSTAPDVDGSSVVAYKQIKYAQGLFMAVGTGSSADLEAYNSVAVSEDGLNWEVRGAQGDPDGATTGFQAVAFGNPNQVGYWLAKGEGSSEDHLARIQTGVQAMGRVGVAAEKVFEVRLFEPGCGYIDGPPTITITDPGNIFDVQTQVRLGKGCLSTPTFVNRGTGYEAASAELATTGNNGFADFFQSGTFMAVRRLSEKPTPGSNIVFDSLPNKVFKLVNTVTFLGTQDGSYTTFLNVSPNMEVADSPPHGDPVTMRIRYSQVRLTGHDFLDIGTGGFADTNYPGVPLVDPDPTKETTESNGGRVFFTSTDQDGNFRVGNLFNVEQSTGVATLNADAFNIAGLQELTLGEVTLGGNSASVTEFSTDPFMTANSDSVVPTQRAVKAYIEAQIGGGGASLNVNTVTAGDIFIGTNQITTVTGTTININATVNFKGGVIGLPLAINYMLR